MPGSALRCKANLQYIAFMNFREQIQFTLKQLEHCTATHVHFANERAIQAVWLHIQLYSPVSKMKSDSVRINADVFAY